jgi:anti-anti-sigma regulatory factor
VILDFRAVGGLTQSTAHELLFEVLHTAQKNEVRLVVRGIQPQVRSTLDLLEGYAL